MPDVQPATKPSEAPVEPAELEVPRQPFVERFKQKLALSFIMLLLIGPFWAWPCTVLFVLFNPFPGARTITLAYFFYVFVLDRRAFMTDKGWTPIRRFKFWKNLANYFPAKLIAKVNLDAKEKYIFCGHPHGICCASFLINFFVEATGFRENFPGISLFPLLLDAHFFTPVQREIALMSGFRGASKDAITSVLNHGAPGTSLFLIVGGGPEALHSRPGHYDLVLKCRKGFAKMALLTGAHLVPVLAFGETDLFDVSLPAEGTLWHRVQQLVLKLTGFGIPSISGAGFWDGAGPLPKARPLNTVIGAPVKVARWTGSTRSDDPDLHAAVDELHARYCAALCKLWDEHKQELAPRRRKSMEFVE
mmetsp:Transcript_36001/g.106454  ORF Transcript_36001/g.106454 Transcript_36001/m.106454 type:complete len:362 (-) Transcript_36001:321-1406(-)